MRKAWWVLLLVIIAAAAASVFVYGKKKPKDKLPAQVDFNVHIRPGRKTTERQSKARYSGQRLCSIKRKPGAFCHSTGKARGIPGLSPHYIRRYLGTNASAFIQPCVK
jgi:hypothetical protein